MRDSWRHLPAPARAVAVAGSAAVAAAQHRDAGAFATAVDDLAALDADQVGLVLGAVVLLVLEDLHPDGLDGDDVRDALDRCVRTASQWQSDVDPLVVLVVLAGALGVHDRDDEAPPPAPQVLARHAALLLAELLAGQRRSLDDYLARAFREIHRGEHMD
jgi:hypothetical protein